MLNLDRHNGNRFGELLLKPVFDFVKENNYDFIFVTAFEKQTALLDLFSAFGFDPIAKKTPVGELVLVKQLKAGPADVEDLAPLEFNRRFGPWVASFNRNETYIVPIQPQFHAMLFPEYEVQQILSIGLAACGNSIRKAYLSNSSISLLKPGDNLLFYRSEDQKAATAFGIVEELIRSDDANRVAQFVGTRTVYPFAQIKELCAKSPVLAIKFRRVRFLNPPIPLQELIENRCITSAPQSIQTIKEQGTKWLAGVFQK